jgi:hypothetical protein
MKRFITVALMVCFYIETQCMTECVSAGYLYSWCLKVCSY